MSWISEAHAHWHVVHGKYAVCPLDCGAAEAMQYHEDYDPADWEAGNVTCGHCGTRNRSIDHVRRCGS